MQPEDHGAGFEFVGSGGSIVVNPDTVDAEDALQHVLRGTLGFTGTPIDAALRRDLVDLAARQDLTE